MLPLYDPVFADKLSRHDLPPALQRKCRRDSVVSDRKAEFDETTSRERAAARQKAESPSISERKATWAQQLDESSKEPKPMKQEPNSSEKDGKHTRVEQRFTIVTPRTQAPWVSESYSACKANKKCTLKNGDLLIILDPKDYGKSCLVDSCDFGKASEPFARLYSLSRAASDGCTSEQGLTGLLVFSVTESAPEFHPMPIDCSFDDLTRSLGPAQGPNFHDGKVDEVKIKLEGGRKNAGSVAADQTASGKKSTGLGTDWPRACDSLLRSIINRQRAHGVSKKDLAAALPQIEGIVSIAQKHGLAHEVHGDFDSLFLEYIGNDSFWELIAKEPVRCLRIGMALRNLPVYEEAFKHLVGMSANSKAGKRFRGLPDEIQANLQRRSRELYNLRRDVNEDLFLISLPAQPPVSLQYPSITVSQQDEPDAYSTVNIFRDWMADHIGYLRGNTSEPPHPYYLCGHEGGCNTIAGFYRIIAAGGEAYLPFDTVWDDFNKDFLQQDEEDPNELDHGAVKEPLAELKTQASKLVSDLAKSTLHLPSTDGLDYLTCVKVGPEDVPWDVSDKDGEGEYSDGD